MSPLPAAAFNIVNIVTCLLAALTGRMQEGGCLPLTHGCPTRAAPPSSRPCGRAGKGGAMSSCTEVATARCYPTLLLPANLSSI